MIVKVRLHSGGHLPTYHGNGECADLYTAESVELEPLEYRLISLGVSMQLPKGYYAQVYSRSSTTQKHGVIMANGVGIIENSYCGDGDVWHFPAVAIRKTVIPAGTRICQFRLVRQEPQMEFETVEVLGNPDRGGIGSTGSR